MAALALRGTLLLAAAMLFSSCALFRPRHKEGAATMTKAGAVEVRFSGISAFTEGDVRDALGDPLATIQSDGLTPATADDAAFFLELYYRKSGYTFANISYTIVNANVLSLKVDEGPLVKLGGITFSGNRHYADPANFQEYIVGQTRERYPRSTPREDLPFVEADVQKGVDFVQRFYQAEGYLDVVVSPAVVQFTDNRSRATMTIAVLEGQKYTFGDVSINGSLVFPPGEVRGLIADQIPLPYTRQRVDGMQRKLEDTYKRRGYFAATVTAESDPLKADGGGRVSAAFTVNPGPLYRFDGTRIVGTDRLKPQFLRNRFRKLSGKVYSPEALDEAYQQVIRTGLFTQLRVTPQPQDDHTLRLDIDVKEARAREFGVSLGYGTYEGAILGFELRDRDFNGTGRPISLSVDYSTRTLSGQLLYLDPYLFETDNQLRIRAQALQRTLDQYDKNEQNLLLEVTRPLTKQFKVGVFALIKYDKIDMLDVLPENAGVTSYSSTSLGATASLDLRDSPVSPTKGLVTDAAVDVATSAFGSSLDFLRGTYRITYFQPIGKKGTLIAGFRLGVIAPMGDSGGSFRLDNPDDPKLPRGETGSRFPIDERFFNGGSTTVRSFGERQMGPFDQRTGQPIGGEAYTIFNLEYLFPLVLADLRGAVFFDAGNLQAKAADLGFGDERYGIGAGLRYNLPIGPLRLDYGVNPNPRANEDFGAFHFSFGFAF